MQSRVRLSAVFAILALTATPSLAQDQPAPPSTDAPATNTQIACVNAGLSYHAGEFACIAACHGRRRLARCDALADKGSWTYVSEACPTSMINQPWPSEWTEMPAVAAMTPVPLVLDRSAIAPEADLKFGELKFADFGVRLASSR